MNDRPIDKRKKSNIYCAHCEHWSGYEKTQEGKPALTCLISGERKKYWCRCKNFEWKNDALYTDDLF